MSGNTGANPATTWADSGGATPNPNPVVLDANGQAIIWGNGGYRQVVKDVNGVTIWDQTVQSPDAGFLTFQSNLADSTNTANGDALVAVKQHYAGAVARTQDSKNADILSILDFGCVADWNGSTGTDNSTFMQNAHNALIGTGCKLWAPRGKYFMGTNYTLDTRHESIELYGEARGKGVSAVNAARFICAGAFVKTATVGSYVPGLGTGQQPLYGYTLSNISIEGKDVNHDHLVQLDALYSCKFNSLYMVGLASGKDAFQLTNFADATFDDYRVNGTGKHGLNIGDARATNVSTTLRIRGGYMRSVHGVGIYGIGAGQASDYIIDGMICEVGGRDPTTYMPVTADIGVGMMFENLTGAQINAYFEGGKNADIVLGGSIDNVGTVTKKGQCFSVSIDGYFNGSAGSGTGTNCVDGVLLVNVNVCTIKGNFSNHSRAEHTIRATLITDVANILFNASYGSVPSGYINDNWNRIAPGTVPINYLIGGKQVAVPTTTTATGVFAAELSGDGLRLPGNTTTGNMNQANGVRYFDSTFGSVGMYHTDGFYYERNVRRIAYGSGVAPPNPLPAGYGTYTVQITSIATTATPTPQYDNQEIKICNAGSAVLTITGTLVAALNLAAGKSAILTYSTAANGWTSTI